MNDSLTGQGWNSLNLNYIVHGSSLKSTAVHCTLLDQLKLILAVSQSEKQLHLP